MHERASLFGAIAACVVLAKTSGQMTPSIRDGLARAESLYALDPSKAGAVAGLVTDHLMLSASKTPRTVSLRGVCAPSLNATEVTPCGAPVVDPGAARGGATAYHYDPVLLTIAANVESRAYRRQEADWKELRPRTGAGAAYFRRPPPLRFRRGDPASRELVVILGSSYSTWRGGSWTNKIAAILDLRIPRPHLIAAPGFLTPEMLAAEPEMPELTGELTAGDLFRRIASAMDEMQESGILPKNLEAGLVGFSGGANVALSMLAEDARQGQTRRFRAGALAFSPVLDLAGTFRLLDESSNAILAKGFPPTHGLTTLMNMIGPFLNGYRPGNLKAFLGIMRADASPARAEDLVHRFYREFQIVDLRGVRKAPYREAVEEGRLGVRLSFDSFYREHVLPLHRRLRSLDPQVTLAEYTGFSRMVAPVVQAPVYVVLAQDDPVLVRSSVSPAHADRVASELDSLRAKSNFRVFHPEMGGHMGYFLDSRYVASVVATFFRGPPIPKSRSPLSRRNNP